MRGRGVRRRTARREKPPARARSATRGRSARSACVARAANEARSGDVAPLDPRLFRSRFEARASSYGGGGREDHAPRDAARKDAAGAATLALIVKVAILFQVATERGAAAKNDPPCEARSVKKHLPPPDKALRTDRTQERRSVKAPYNFSGFRVGKNGS